MTAHMPAAIAVDLQTCVVAAVMRVQSKNGGDSGSLESGIDLSVVKRLSARIPVFLPASRGRQSTGVSAEDDAGAHTGFTRIRHFMVAEVGNIRFGGGAKRHLRGPWSDADEVVLHGNRIASAPSQVETADRGRAALIPAGGRQPHLERPLVIAAVISGPNVSASISSETRFPCSSPDRLTVSSACQMPPASWTATDS